MLSALAYYKVKCTLFSACGRFQLSPPQVRVGEPTDFLKKDMGEDRWLCTLLVEKGWRLEYCAVSENTTFCPDNFDEFFKQRRRWIPSTLANLSMCVQHGTAIIANNNHVGFGFILYQVMKNVNS